MSDSGKVAPGQKPWRYLIALGSNMPHPVHGPPAAIIGAAMERLNESPLACIARSPVVASLPLGPSRRRFANAAAIVETLLDPPRLLRQLQELERGFGRRSGGGQRWRARRLDLDIALWSGGKWKTRDLTIPHPSFATRDFVLKPALTIARNWRDPLSNRTIAHLAARLSKHST